MLTYAYGFPRLGRDREFKKLIEKFWKKELTSEQLGAGIKELEEKRYSAYEKYAGSFPTGEMTYYDNMLDTALMVGLYSSGGLDGYFDLCRGQNALEMRKWFNTNYHYLVPQFTKEFTPDKFKFSWNKLKGAVKPAGRDGISYLIGPFTFLRLSKGISKKDFPAYLSSLAGVYCEIVKGLGEVHIDEPAFTADVTKKEAAAIKEAYNKITAANKNINLFTYYESVNFLKELYDIPFKSIGLDFVNGDKNLKTIKKIGFPDDKLLVAGIVNGRNVWKTDIKKAVKILKALSKRVKNIAISNAAPLYHLPVSLQNEDMEPGVKDKLAFAEERLYELKLIADAYDGKNPEEVERYNAGAGNFGQVESVQQRVRALKDADFLKPVGLKERRELQQKILNLPLFPTTTIGSFPQTKEIRGKRADFRAGRITKEEYEKFINEQITGLVKFQEDIGLDVLVHGEFERTDMVEFFAEKLNGIATTKNGWIISYGTRGYRPPIIFGDIVRPEPMTVKEIAFAQTLTKKPVKGMLTGPVTIIAWSFVREDIHISNVAYQLAFCIQDEIRDYEQKGIKIVQIDEPAIRERAPIKKKNWDEYFGWAVRSFNLAAISKPETQIHTHMCYSAFGEIIDRINSMDFDKITIEASRTKGDIIKSFEKINFQKQIGIGVWDIHSPKIPSVKDMEKIVKRALKVIPKENFWINPDCGLKTRDWPETKESLKNLVELAGKMRKKYQAG